MSYYEPFFITFIVLVTMFSFASLCIIIAKVDNDYFTLFTENEYTEDTFYIITYKGHKRHKLMNREQIHS